MLRSWRQLATVLFVLTFAFATPAILGAQAKSEQPRGDSYTWSGELVSVDVTGKTMTVKSRVAYQEAVAELKQFKAGDRVWVVWSGDQDYSDAVRQVKRSETGRKIEDKLVMPAELVSPEATNQYITIRLKVPESSLAALQTVKPGEWVTVTSRHRPSTDADAVVAVRPYGASPVTN